MPHLPVGHSTPLEMAMMLNGIAIVQAAIDAQPENLPVKTPANMHSLHLLAERGDEARFKILLQRGAKCDIRNAQGYTPLHYAAMNGHKEIVMAILEQQALLSRWCLVDGFDIDSKTANGKTAWLLAKENNQHEMVTLLEKHGANNPSYLTTFGEQLVRPFKYHLAALISHQRQFPPYSKTPIPIDIQTTFAPHCWYLAK